MTANAHKLVILILALAAPFVSLAACEEEIRATQEMSQTKEQSYQNEVYRQLAERPDLLETQSHDKSLAVKAHFEENIHSPGRHRFRVDKFPLSACLMKVIAEDRSKFYAPFAQESFALKLLAGDGVPRSRLEAIKYLTRASESWHYGSAAIRLGRLYLEGKPAKEDVERAVYFLNRALKLAPTTEGGSANPGDALEILFDLYLGGKDRAQDIVSARKLLEKHRKDRSASDHIYKATVKYPTLAQLEKDIAEEERQSAINERNRRPEPRREICTTYRSGFTSCRSI